MSTTNSKNDLSKQIKVTQIVSAYPSKLNSLTTLVGGLAQGTTIGDQTTKQISNASYLQGQFFQSLSKINFNDLEATKSGNSDQTWSYKRNIDNVEHKMTINKSEILNSISLKEVLDTADIDETANKYNIDKEETYITVNGKKYFINMNIPINFSTDKSTGLIVNIAIYIFGTKGLAANIAIAAAKIGTAGVSFITLGYLSAPLIDLLWSTTIAVLQLGFAFVQAFIGGIIGGESVVAAFAAGQTAAGELIAEGVFSAITTTALASTLVGILVIATIYLIFKFVLHNSYQNIYVYNLTTYDMDIDFGYISEGSPHNVESKHLPAKADKMGQNDIDLGSWYSATGFRFQSNSEYSGIGYAMSIILKYPKTNTIFKKMACMFDIPFEGDNSLKATTNYPSDIKSFYEDNEGNIKSTQNSDGDGQHEIIATYDYISGEHNDPQKNDQEYIYNSLVIIRDKVTEVLLPFPGEIPKGERPLDGKITLKGSPK